ncbi:MAG: histidine phosphatase family protein [Candidatus Limnocylindria bacterium]
MPKLIIVKHSLPHISPERPRNAWRLSHEGRVRAVRLGERLRTYDVDRIVTSPEPKASETATIVAETLGSIPVAMVDALREHDDRDVPFQDETSFRASVRRFFARPSGAVFGPETADDAHERFSAGVEALIPSRDGAATVVVAHGRVISLFVARRNRLDLYDLWVRLGLPSFVILDRPSYSLVEVTEDV